MIDYTGLNCPVCNKPFSKDDDIVVCPECGAPYHRECYMQVGKCIFLENHSTHTAWAAPKQEQSNNTDSSKAENKTKVCPRCGNKNSEEAMFCSRCGQSLTVNQPDFKGVGQNGYPNKGTQFQQSMPFIFDPLGGVNPDEPIDNIPAGDIAKLVQSNTQYYLPIFMRLKRFRKNRFNFSAFLFSGGWMLYRKQYKIGTIITAIMVVLQLLSTYVSMYFSVPMLQELLQQQGYALGSSAPTYEQMFEVSELLLQLPAQQIFLFCVPSILLLIKFIIMLVVGFNGNKWYLDNCIEKVNQIQKNSSDSIKTSIQFKEQGGVNTSLAICMMICYLIVMYLPQIIF